VTGTCEPEDAIAIFSPWSLHAALVDRKLMPERDVLQDELRAVLGGEAEQRD